MVSPDTSIAIAFGILSTVISLLGVWIGYLTLRAMASENHGSSPRDIEYRPIQRHKYTHIVTSIDRRELENKSIGWQD